MAVNEKLFRSNRLYPVLMVGVLVLASSCSREVAPYDELVRKGSVEKLVRKKYAGFFKGISQLAAVRKPDADVQADSVFVKKAAQLTDRVIADVLRFPSSVDSRLAFDALSYAAYDLTVSESFPRSEVSFFWENALIDPLLRKGREYIKSGETNESTILQIATALQRGMGSRATNDMLMVVISIIGPNPPRKVMEVCEADSLVLRRAFDLIHYTRSLQKYGPPLWMTTGAWFMGVEIGGWPPAFFCLRPVIIDKQLYLTFRDYDHSTFYGTVFDDPVPGDSDKMEAWLTRAEAVMNSLVFDEKLAQKISNSSFPFYDTHNFYDDYLIHTDADSVRKEFAIVLKREKIRDSAFSFAGMDSISVLFTTNQISNGDGLLTKLAATRVQGSSMSGGRIVPGRRGEGTAYLIPVGPHSTDMLKEIQKASVPEIKVKTR
ncbi:hypothetical protein LLG96_00945 [bacterium]|nr:hypothetical protein [bacterium]